MKDVELIQVALLAARQAMADWLHEWDGGTSEPQENVAAAVARIREHGGHVGYIADVTAQIDAALTAADAIASLLDGYDSLRVQSHRDIASGWVAVPECEWDQVMRQVFGE